MKAAKKAAKSIARRPAPDSGPHVLRVDPLTGTSLAVELEKVADTDGRRLMREKHSHAFCYWVD